MITRKILSLCFNGDYQNFAMCLCILCNIKSWYLKEGEMKLLAIGNSSSTIFDLQIELVKCFLCFDILLDINHKNVPNSSYLGMEVTLYFTFQLQKFLGTGPKTRSGLKNRHRYVRWMVGGLISPKLGWTSLIIICVLLICFRIATPIFKTVKTYSRPFITRTSRANRKFWVKERF